jgi:single-strand DNA-binding protein
MATDNSVTLAGNVTRDPELAFTPNGAVNVKFGLAVSRKWQNRTTQEWEEETSFFNVVAWNALADNIAETISKGQRVLVVGRVDVRTWEKSDGTRGTSVDLVADDIGPSLKWATAEVTKAEKRQGSSGGGQQNASPRQPKPPRQAPAPSYGDEEPF